MYFWCTVFAQFWPNSILSKVEWFMIVENGHGWKNLDLFCMKPGRPEWCLFQRTSFRLEPSFRLNQFHLDFILQHGSHPLLILPSNRNWKVIHCVLNQFVALTFFWCPVSDQSASEYFGSYFTIEWLTFFFAIHFTFLYQKKWRGCVFVVNQQ